MDLKVFGSWIYKNLNPKKFIIIRNRNKISNVRFENQHIFTILFIYKFPKVKITNEQSKTLWVLMNYYVSAHIDHKPKFYRL